MAERDAELVAQSLSGNRAAFGELVRTHMRWVGAVAAGVLGDFTAARDVACEAFRRAFVSLSKLGDRARVRPWLYTITQRTALDWLRYNQESLETTTMQSVGTGEPEPRQQVLAEILALPPHYREAILLRHIGGCSCAEAAGLMSVPEADAAARLAGAEHALALRVAQLPSRRGGLEPGQTTNDE